MTALLPVGTYVLVKDPGCRNTAYSGYEVEWLIEPCEYYAVVVGYDMFRSKYEVGIRFGGWGEWLFGKGGYWPFPQWVTEVTEAEAKAIPAPFNESEA